MCSRGYSCRMRTSISLEALRGNLKRRYIRKIKRIFFICLVIGVVVGFTTISFLHWPSEAEFPSRRMMPVHTGSSHENSSGIKNEGNPHIKTVTDPKYLINSSNCRVQDFPAFHDDGKRFFNKSPLKSCSNRPLLSSVSRNANGTHTLHLHKEHISAYVHGTETFCCYSIMSIDYESANLSADIMEIGDCQKFNGNVLLNHTIEFVQVTCHFLQTTSFFDNESVDVYKNVHAFVGMKPQVKAKIEKFHTMMRLTGENATKNDTMPYSVMLFGIDSMSRLNFLRTMPKTAEYLKRAGWLPLKVYNKAAESTFPNLAAAVLAGMPMEAFDKTCVTLNECPWILERISEKGYITAYGEDYPQHDTFSIRKLSKAPTDYFLRPFMRAAERLSGHSWFEKFLEFFDCLGPVHGADHVLNYSLEFAKAFKSHPTFSLFWLNSFSHGCLNCAWGWDKRLVEYFQDLEFMRSNTVIFFLSDHGPGEGGFRETNMGFFEQKLPVIYVSVPESFAEDNPEKFDNFIKNEYKLASPFDVHVTLLDLVGEEKFAPGCPKCLSLFENLPHNRSCADAGILEKYCACTEYDIVSDTTPYKFMGEFVLRELNKIVRSNRKYVDNEFKCATFSLKGMKPIRIAVPPQSGYLGIVQSIKNVFSTSPDHDLFVVTIETVPRAIFEATVSQNENGTLAIVDTVSRIDQYEAKSKCMGKREWKKYCVCESKQVEF